MSHPAYVYSAPRLPVDVNQPTQQPEQMTGLLVQLPPTSIAPVADESCRRRNENKEMDESVPAFTNPTVSLDQLPLLLSPSAPHPQRAAFPPSHKTLQHYSASPLTDQNRIESMIARGDQCNVHTAPSAPDVIVPADIMDLSCMQLEVDEANSGPEDDIPGWADGIVTLRRAGGPEGIRKRSLPRYNTAASVAMQCRNLVRSRPRMRRRKKTLQSELYPPTASSTLTASDSVMSPPASPTLFPV